METLEQCVKYAQWYQWRSSGFFIIDFEQISHTVLLFSLLTLSK